MLVYFEKKIQIKRKAQVGAILLDKAPTIVLTKYSSYSNIFSTKNIAELLKLPEYTITLSS